MLSPPACSPVKRASSGGAQAGTGYNASPSKLTRSPLWLRSPPGHTPVPTHIAAASPSARRGLFSSGDDDDASNKAGPPPTPIDLGSPQSKRGSRHTRPAQVGRAHPARANTPASSDDSPAAAAAVRWHGAGSGGAGPRGWGKEDEDEEEEAGPGYSAFNIASVAASAQHMAAAVLRVGTDALTGPAGGRAGDLEARAHGSLSSELARRTARSLSTPDPVLLRGHSGREGLEADAAAATGPVGGGPVNDQEPSTEGTVLRAGMTHGPGAPKASPALRAKLLLSYLDGDDHAKLQGALSLLLDHLKTGKLSATHMMDAGAVPQLARLIARHSTGCTPAAAAAIPPGSKDHPVEQGATALAALEVTNTLVVSLPPEAASHAGSVLLPLVAPVLDILQVSAARLKAQGGRLVLEAEQDNDVAHWPRLPITFYAGSVIVRLSVHAEPATALVRGGAIATLTANLAAHPTVLPQVCVFALYKLLEVGSHADNLLELMQNGGAHGLVAFMKHSGSKKGDAAACELAATMLLALALLPEAPQAAADANLVAPLVQLLGPAAPSPAVRMYALLILGRLGSRSSAVQMDLTREGAVPYLVALMRPQAPEAEQLHAARLTAILAQAVPTHQALQCNDVMEALLRLLQSDRPSVVEHVASVFSVLANNPSTHFQVVGWGAVPVLVRLLQPSSQPDHFEFRDGQLDVGVGHSESNVRTPKTQTYVLATLLLLAMHEPRHADVICRSGAIPSLVHLCSRGETPNVREYAAAVLACMAHTVDVQVDIIGSGGVPALVSLLEEGVPEAQAHAAEVLVTLSAVDDHRKRLITRASEILTSLLRLLYSTVPTSRYWGAALLHMLCRDDAVLLEVLEMKEVLPALASILSDMSLQQEAEARLAQVQAAWLIARLCESTEASTALANLQVAPSLVALVSAGMLSQRQGLGGGVHYGTLGYMPPRDSFPDSYSDLPGVRSTSSSNGAAGLGMAGGRDGAGGDSWVAGPALFQAGAAFGVTSSSLPHASSSEGTSGDQSGKVRMKYDGQQVSADSSSSSSSSSSSVAGEQENGSIQGGAGAARAGTDAHGSDGRGSRLKKRQLRIEPLESNAHAAGVAALLALARSSSAGREAVEHALAFQEAWAGGSAPRVVLAALAAPAIS